MSSAAALACRVGQSEVLKHFDPSLSEVNHCSEYHPVIISCVQSVSQAKAVFNIQTNVQRSLPAYDNHEQLSCQTYHFRKADTSNLAQEQQTGNDTSELATKYVIVAVALYPCSEAVISRP